MKSRVVASLTRRITTEAVLQAQLRFLKEHDVNSYVNTVISTLYLYTRPKKGYETTSVYMAELISALGHGVRTKLKLKRDSNAAAKLGAFLLYTFEELGYIKVILGVGTRHATYIVTVTNDNAIVSMWSAMEASHIEKLPSGIPYAPWTSTKHNAGIRMVKTNDKGVLDKIAPETHPILFNVLNKAQAVGWRIHKEIYDLHAWALRNKTDAFADIWEQQNPEAKATKIREVKAIGEMAKKFLNSPIYHLYYYDFRGRKYTNTAYLHEQGNDLARALLQRIDKKKIGRAGYWWMLVSIASNWGGDSGRLDGLKTDKIPLQERYLWALDNEDILLAYAEKPKVHQGWMKADKPWQFLVGCIELKRLREWQYQYGNVENPFEDYNYESHMEAYIDGSNNGSQHLAALTLDEVTAPHVNLVPLELPGDLYSYVAGHVWDHLHELLKDYPEEEREDCEIFIDNLIELKKKITAAEPKSDVRRELIASIQTFKEANQYILDKSAAVYWFRIEDAKHKRKIVKRNTMTIPL